ncbi:MAG: hypothetical protein JW934_17400 [Anaerolineae bacterium]|nr:hypothetical protein [Anaerolineae bacterium]
MNWQMIGSKLGPFLTLMFASVAVACLALVYRMRRTAQSTHFGFVREQSVLGAWRLVVVAIVSLLLAVASGTLWSVAVKSPELLPTVAPTSTLTLIPSPTPRTPTPTFTPTCTPTVTPTPTRTPLPPDAELPTALRTPFPAQAVEPGEDAALVDLALAVGEENNQPVAPGVIFPAGTERIYAFFTFDGMAKSVPWIHIWYIQADDEWIEYWSTVELWQYSNARGATWRYINVRPGRYELHIYIGYGLQQKIPFTVQDGE